MSHIKRIFIIGHHGAGKGLLAKTLANKLGWQFINADLGLESRFGRTIHELLGKKGEEAFYDCESELLTTQLALENIVVATDASIACSEKNQHLLSEEFVVFLQVSTSVQMERNARSTAPLLPTPDIKVFFDKLHSERDAIYGRIASISLNSDENSLDKHVSIVCKIVLKDEISPKSDPLKLETKDKILFHKKTHVPVHLTQQQATSLKLLAMGKSSKEIARDMNISYRTIEGVIAKTMELLGCTSSKELIALYHGQP